MTLISPPVPRHKPDIRGAQLIGSQLHKSIVYGDIDGVWREICEGPEVVRILFQDKRGSTALQVALANGRFKIATLLLMCGAPVDQTNRSVKNVQYHI